MIPHIKTAVPDLERGKKEALLVYDLPKTHRLSVELRIELWCLGVWVMALPHNSTNWSQACDSRFCFGAFKGAYYTLIDTLMIRESTMGRLNHTIKPEMIPALCNQAMKTITDARKLASFRVS